MYQEILERIENSAGDADRQYAKNTLSWLLCARWKQDLDEFLMAVSVPVYLDYQVTKEQILGICCNLVMFDSTLDTFRFAHLSVREFLEKKGQYSSTKTNAFVAETSLGTLLRHFGSDAQYPTNSGQRSLHYYAGTWWGFHCQAANDERQRGTLRQRLELFLADHVTERSPFYQWMEEVILELEGIILDKLPLLEARDVIRRLKCCFSRRDSAIMTACVFDPYEVVKRNQAKLEDRDWQNLEGSKCLDAVAKFGNLNTLEVLLAVKSLRVTDSTPVAAMGNIKSGIEVMDLLLARRESKDIVTIDFAEAAVVAHGITALTKLPVEEITIPEKLIVRAAEDQWDGANVMTFLLAERGHQVTAAEQVVMGAVRNPRSGPKLLALLLAERGHQVTITDDVVMEAVRNLQLGKEVMAILLKEQGHEVTITEQVFMEVVRNQRSTALLTLLLEERGHEVTITKKVVMEAVQNEMSGIKVMAILLKERGHEIKITEQVVMEVVRKQRSTELLTLLLNERGHEVTTTKKVVMEAVRNRLSRATTLVFPSAERE